MEQNSKQLIQDIASLLHENKLSEIEYETNDVYIRVSSASKNPVFEQKTLAAEEPKGASVQTVAEIPKEFITSPMVGVVYLAKDETSPPYVKVGDMVSVGQTVCLVEAMKTFNPIKAAKAGKIIQVLIKSGEPVEFGQHLFEIG